MAADTFGTRLERANGTTTGFDYMRLLLASSILIYHSYGVSQGEAAATEVWGSPYRAFAGLMLPMFFALSGFLVFASLLRLRALAPFILYRTLRIIPALCVEVTLSALLLGPLFTFMPLADYFRHPDFAEYFLNILGDVHYTLPGLFWDNPRAGIVNVSLWTIPYELQCYALLTVLGLCRLMPKRGLMLVLAIAGIALGTAHLCLWGDLLQYIRPVGPALVAAFITGGVMYLYRERIPHNGKLALLAAFCLPLLLYLPQTSYLAAIPAAYLVAYLGTFNPAKKSWLMRGDYSYGLYLFAFPMQQTIVLLWPQYNSWAFNAVAALVLAMGWAVLSWHLVEQPVLRRKGQIATWLRLQK